MNNKNIMTPILICLLILLTASFILADEDDLSIEAQAIIDRILTVEKQQRDSVKTLSLDAEYVEGEIKDDGFKEKVRFVKKVYLRFSNDSTWMAEEYLEYYKDGKLQKQKDMDKEVKERNEKKKKRKARDLSSSIIDPFKPIKRDSYKITYHGLKNEEVEGYTTHHFEITAKAEIDTLINGHFYFDAETFHLIKTAFSPAKLVKKTMFKLNELNMVMTFGPEENGFWFPRQFDISGKGKAMFFIGVKFAGSEYYRNPIINENIDSKFEVENE